MDTKESEKAVIHKGGKPGWTVKRTAFNFGEKHARMLDELVLQARKENHRANFTTVVEEAIENLHDVRISQTV